MIVQFFSFINGDIIIVLADIYCKLIFDLSLCLHYYCRSNFIVKKGVAIIGSYSTSITDLSWFLLLLTSLLLLMTGLLLLLIGFYYMPILVCLYVIHITSFPFSSLNGAGDWPPRRMLNTKKPPKYYAEHTKDINTKDINTNCIKI